MITDVYFGGIYLVKVKVTRSYQITLPKNIRKKLGIKVGDYVSIKISGEAKAILKKLIFIEDLAGTCDEEMDDIMENIREQWKTWKL